MDAFETWLKALEENGVTPEQAAALFDGTSKLTAIQLYGLIVASLKKEDMEQINAIADDDEAQLKIKELFQLRTGMSVEDAITQAQDGFFQKAVEALKQAK